MERLTPGLGRHWPREQNRRQHARERFPTDHAVFGRDL